MSRWDFKRGAIWIGGITGSIAFWVLLTLIVVHA